MMEDADTPQPLFAPRQSRQESKADTTTSIARGIIADEKNLQASKTARLRAMRLAKEEAEAEAAPVVKPKRVRKKPAAK